ncbi:unnamed protein product [Adineta steineri]|uniref:F-box domain-containing protein n=1 Tax=Adineta steineri TaxID=433720 RepID=A0A815GXS2_9BILA|nr:unnamed protein product [Adineta steineri]
MAEAHLLYLPVEILHHIFHYCDAQTILCKIRLVCKRLRDVVNSYNQIELEFNRKNQINFYRFFRFVSPNTSSSLSIPLEDRYMYTYDHLPSMLSFNIHRFTKVRHLSLRNMSDEGFHLIFEYLNCMQLKSLTIDSKDRSGIHTCSVVLSMIKKSNPRKLSWMEFSDKVENMPWPNQCQLMYLTMDSCLYSQYPAIVQQLPCLKTLRLARFIMDIDNMPNVTFSSQLTCLIIRYCSLSIEHLRILVSNTTALRDLRLGFDEKKLGSIVDIYCWEKFVRTELNFLNRFEFFISYKLSSDDTIYSLDSLVVPFREPFWLLEKRWFVVCGYNFYSSRTISLHTIPVTVKDYDTGHRINAILFIHNSYYICNDGNYRFINTIAFNMLVELDLNYKQLEDLGAQYLAHGLQINQALEEIDRSNNKIEDDGAQYLALALRNNTVILIQILRIHYLFNI